MDKPAVERTVVRDRASETNMVFQFAAETIQTAYRSGYDFSGSFVECYVCDVIFK